MMDWVPIVFAIFKFLAFGTCMFLAIKWHHDQGKRGSDKRAVLRAGAKVTAALLLLLLGLGFLTFVLAGVLGLDLSPP